MSEGEQSLKSAGVRVAVPATALAGAWREGEGGVEATQPGDENIKQMKLGWWISLTAEPTHFGSFIY